jgi:hypothetical protein
MSRIIRESSTMSTPDPLEQLRSALDGRMEEARAVVALAQDDGVVVDLAQALAHHLAAAREVVDLARPDVEQVARDDRDALHVQVLDDELRVLLPHVGEHEALQHVAAAEDLGFEALAVAAELEDLVDQQLHRVHAVAPARGDVAVEPTSLPSSGSMKWFMPPMPVSRSRRHAETHEPSTVTSAMSLLVA